MPMSSEAIHKLEDQLESLGESEVRRLLSSGQWGEPGSEMRSRVEDWLRAKEVERDMGVAVAVGEGSVATREAVSVAREANEIARSADATAKEALSTAKAALRTARQERTAAWIAAIAAIIAAIFAVIK